MSDIRPYGGQAHVYDLEYRQYDGDVPFYIERLRAAHVTAPVLDLGCGTGRVALPLVQAGYTVWGLDLSVPMLRRARVRRRALPQEQRARLRIFQKDIDDFHFAEAAGAALVPFSTFALLVTEEARRRCLACCRAQLLPGAPLLIDVFALTPRASDVHGPRTLQTTEFRLPRGHRVVKRVDEETDRATGLDHVRYHYTTYDVHDEHVLEQYTVAFPIARLEEGPLLTLVDAAGFDVREVYGNYEGAPFGPRSPRLIVEAVRGS